MTRRLRFIAALLVATMVPVQASAQTPAQLVDLDLEDLLRINVQPRRQYGGFGLGLWIARETARALGGELSLASAPDVGSTFIVSMPRMVSGNANRASPAADAPPPQAPRAEPSERAEI